MLLLPLSGIVSLDIEKECPVMSEKINVCLLNDSFPPAIDGVANAVFNYASIIQNKLGSVIVATPHYPDVVDDYPFPVVRYPSVNVPSLGDYRVGLPVHHLISELTKHKIDIIHCHCPYASGFASKELHAALNVPVVMTYHTKFDIDVANIFDSKLIQEVAAKLIVSNVKICDEVWAVSAGAGENLKGLGYDGDYRIMSNGVDLPKGKAPQSDIDELVTAHSLSADVPVFLFVGRMMWYKGLKIILDGLTSIKSAGMLFKMIFVGDGAEYHEITEYTQTIGLSEECVFAGAVRDRNKLRAYYSCADAFLFPSTYDTSGIVVGEAAACGLMSILIRGSSAAECVTDGRNGILIEENAQSLASALQNLIKNRDHMKELGQHAMDELYLSWEDAVKRAYNRYCEIL